MVVSWTPLNGVWPSVASIPMLILKPSTPMLRKMSAFQVVFFT